MAKMPATATVPPIQMPQIGSPRVEPSRMSPVTPVRALQVNSDKPQQQQSVISVEQQFPDMSRRSDGMIKENSNGGRSPRDPGDRIKRNKISKVNEPGQPPSPRLWLLAAQLEELLESPLLCYDESKLRRVVREEMSGLLGEMMGMPSRNGKKTLQPQAPAKPPRPYGEVSEPRPKGAGLQALREPRGDARPQGDMPPGSPKSTLSPEAELDIMPPGVLAMQRRGEQDVAPVEQPDNIRTDRDEEEGSEFDTEYLRNASAQLMAKPEPYRQYMPAALSDRYEWLMSLHEPPRVGPLASFVEGPFDKVCTLVIVLNALTTFFNTNWQVQNYGQESATWQTLDVVFVIFYTTELALKISVHKSYFFWNDNMHWNYFDAFLVCAGIYDQLSALIFSDRVVNLVFLRMLRLLKMAKILRVFRLIRSLAVLRLILNSILGSMSSLLWSVVMMTIIFFMFGLVFVQNAAGYFADHSSDMSDEAIRESELMARFGTVEQAMIGLYMSCTGGDDWRNFYDVLVPVGWLTASLYLFFVAFSQIALMNILTGIFVENAMSLAQPDRQAQFAEEQRRFRSQHEELTRIITAMDKDQDGQIDIEEFRRGMAEEGPGSLQTYLGSTGIHEADAEHFYHTLRAAQFGQRVDISSFVGGCIKLRGEARSLDMQALMFEMKVVHKMVHDIFKDVREVKGMEATIEEELDRPQEFAANWGQKHPAFTV